MSRSHRETSAVRPRIDKRVYGPIRALGVLSLLCILTGCVTVPQTHRKALTLISLDQEIAMGEEAYREVLRQSTLSKNERWIAIVERVGTNIARVSDMPRLKWEFKVIESTHMNAFCLPGGKVVVYTGIMPVARNEAGLAAVVGHEIAHAVARHGAERVSQAMLVQLGLGLADLSLKDSRHRQTILAALGLGVTVGVLLPYSREHEREADEIGTIYMAKAGYDPNEAVRLWERFSHTERETGPEFLSTHPASSRRAEELRSIVENCMQYYLRAPHQYGKGETL